jgi:hypothetical protein
MSDITVGNILKQIEELPFTEQWRLHNLLGDKLSKQDKAASDRRVSPVPMPDYKSSLQWLAEHAREYAGQWVALDGGRLIAHGPDHQQVSATAKADGAYLPLIELVEDPDAPPFAGF